MPQPMRRLSPTIQYTLAGIVAVASGFGIGKAIFDARVSPDNMLASAIVKIVAAQFVGTIGAVVAFIIVMKVLKGPEETDD